MAMPSLPDYNCLDPFIAVVKPHLHLQRSSTLVGNISVTEVIMFDFISGVRGTGHRA